jgi:O-antigen/teichoic acid export membrane protein
MSVPTPPPSPPPAAAPGLLVRARQLWAVVRLRPFDQSTEAGRSQERYRRAALTTLASFAGKGIAVLTTLVTVPLTLSYLGPERYGMWMTISSFIALVSFTDLGIGSALIGAISETNAARDDAKAREYVSGAAVMLGAMVAALSVAFAVAYPFVPWARVFNVQSGAASSEAGPAVAALLLCQMGLMLLSFVGGVRMGFQEGFVNAIWGVLGSVFALVGVLVAVYVRASLPWLIVSVSVAPVLALLFNAWALFGRDHRAIRPSWAAVNRESLRRLFGLGLLFLILQLSVALAFSSANLVAAQVLGPEAVTQYSVPFRLFGIAMMVVMALVAPLWPAYADAIARGDAAWVRRTLARSLTFSVAFGVVTSLILVVFGGLILRAWVGPTVVAPFGLLLGFGIWNVLAMTGTALSMLFNGAHVFRFQAWSALTMAATNLGLSIVLARHVGVAGIIWGGVISYTICCVIPWAFFVPRLLARIAERRGHEPVATAASVGVGG